MKGTWNLYNASNATNAALDFVVLFGSLISIIGQPGQTNYIGANTFMDAFAQYRSNLGLPASAIQIDAVGEVGYLAQNKSVMQRITYSLSLESTISERELFEVVEAAVNLVSSKHLS